MKNSKRKRRVLLSLLMICLTGVVLSASTYAWFTANRTVTVNSIDVTVASANGIQVSTDGETWKTIITNEDITGASATYTAAVNQLPNATARLAPVSTVGTYDYETGFIDMYLGEIGSNPNTGTSILTATKTTETNSTSGNFIVFDLFVKLTTASNVYFTNNSNVVATGTATGIQNAARMAIINHGNTSALSQVSTIRGLKFAQVQGAVEGDPESGYVEPPIKIWEFNNDAHTAAAVLNASRDYQITTSAGTSEVTALESYYGVKAPITAAALIPLNSHSTDYFEEITPDYSTPVAGIPTTAYQLYEQLQAGVTKLRIYMWIEGQDVDCENDASGGAVSFTLQMSVNSNA